MRSSAAAKFRNFKWHFTAILWLFARQNYEIYFWIIQ